MRFINRLSDYSGESILNELRRVAKQLGKETLTMADLKHARLCYATIKDRFGGLRQALKRAGLQSPVFNRNVSDEELLLELERIWDMVLQLEGRRPYKDDLTKYEAKYSQGPYYRRWGSWIKACEALLNWEERKIFAIENNALSKNVPEKAGQPSRPKRQISLRMRYEILKRDNFTCVLCGRSPATCPGLKLHVDHVIPHSKDGPTELDNLRTLCEECNIGRGNL